MNTRKQALQLPKRMLWFYINNKEAHRNIFLFMMGHTSGYLTNNSIPNTQIPLKKQNSNKTPYV